MQVFYRCKFTDANYSFANYLHVYRCKLFVRWMHGTCVETPPQRIPHEDEPYIFSFFNDIYSNPEVIQLIQNVHTISKNILIIITRYLTRWKKFKGMWKVDKVLRRLSISCFYSQMLSKYQNLFYQILVSLCIK